MGAPEAEVAAELRLDDGGGGLASPPPCALLAFRCVRCLPPPMLAISARSSGSISSSRSACEIQRRYGGDLGRYSGDIGEIWRRYGGDIDVVLALGLGRV